MVVSPKIIPEVSIISYSMYRYHPKNAFHMFTQHIHFMNVVIFPAQSTYFPQQNAAHFKFLLVHKIFMFHIKYALVFKFPAPRPKG
jgi:hypothetical protein